MATREGCGLPPAGCSYQKYCPNAGAGATSIAVQYGLTHLPANQAVVLFLSELVFAAVSSYFLAGEEMGLQEMIGAVLIVSASLLSGKMHTEPHPTEIKP